MHLTALLFVTIFVAACVMALVRHPIYGAMAYVGAFYVQPAYRWWGESLGHQRWSFWAALVAVIAILIHRKKLRPSRFFREPLVIGYLVFLVWICVQYAWVYDKDMHAELIEIYFKFFVALYIIYRSIDTERHLKFFLATHVWGCMYLGWYAFQFYSSGRFEGFGVPVLSEANTAANQILTGIVIAASFLLAGSLAERAAVVAGMPFLLNAVITTISRSAFLSFGVSGLLFNLYSPKRYKKAVFVLSLLGLVAFVSMTTVQYWERIGSLAARGQAVEGVDTGHGRILLIQAQVEMFSSHLMGCGHRCTAVLAPQYLEERYLDPIEKGGTRSSHNTIMTLLVEQGIFGGLFYLGLVYWVFRAQYVARQLLAEPGTSRFMVALLPALMAAMGAIFVGELFVDYLKHEVRVWLLAVMIVYLELLKASASTIGPPKAGVVTPGR